MFTHKKAGETPFGVSSTNTQVSANTPVSAKSSLSSHSIVDECLTMKGDLESEGDILVKGKVLGNIRCAVLIIDVGAVVEGGVEAQEVVIRGKINGTIQSQRVRLEKTADVDSEICHDTFSVEEGARIKGTIRLNGESRNSQANTVKAKESVRNKKATCASEDVTSAPAELVESGGA